MGNIERYVHDFRENAYCTPYMLYVLRVSLKALQVLNLNGTRASVSLVLAKDGTKVDSNDFFLCLPENTEFIALIGSKKWATTKTGMWQYNIFGIVELFNATRQP